MNFRYLTADEFKRDNKENSYFFATKKNAFSTPAIERIFFIIILETSGYLDAI